MTREYTLEDGRRSAGLRKLCDSRDAHEEHMWWEESTHRYCRGFMTNILLGIQGILARVDQLDREDAAQPKHVDRFDGYVYSLVSRMTGEMCTVPDSSAAFWIWRNSPDAFRVVRENPHPVTPIVTEWFDARTEDWITEQ